MIEPCEGWLQETMSLETEMNCYRENLMALSELKKHISNLPAWLDEPNGNFGGRRPRELLNSGEAKRLVAMVRSLYEAQSNLDDSSLQQV